MRPSAIGLAFFAPLAAAVPASAAVEERCSASASLAEPIARASRRFALPETLIRAVIAVESNYLVLAVSRKGAMGLMQLMPATWAGLRLRYALGTNPFDPCDNIYAGTGYLRELLDKYGDPGFLAAYNAGPGRYEAYVSGSRPLPLETIAYVARIASVPLDRPSFGALPRPARGDWIQGPVFAREPAPDAAKAEKALADTLFVARTGGPK